MTRQPKKVAIVGWFGERNAGDEAFRLVFEQEFADHDLSFGQKPDNTADVVVYGGGGVVIGGYLRGLEHEAYAIGVDIPVNGPNWDRIMSLPFKKVFLRSKEYAAIAKAQGLEAEYIPDIVFALERPKKVSRGRQRTVGVSVTSDLADHHYADLALALDTIAESTQIVFIPMFHGTKNSDVETQNRLIAHMKRWDKVQCADCGHDPLLVLNRVASVDFMISMRFHGVIFSTIAGVPFMSLATSGKHSLYCEQERLKHLFVELRELTTYRIVDQYRHISGDPLLKYCLSAVARRNRKAVRTKLQEFRTSVIEAT